MHATVHVTTPRVVSSEHQRGLRWFASLTRHLGQELTRKGDPQSIDDNTCLQNAVQLYEVFVETDDAMYLEMADDFLKHALDLPRP